MPAGRFGTVSEAVARLARVREVATRVGWFVGREFDAVGSQKSTEEAHDYGRG